MRIGIVGGTGREGKGLAVRWARAGHSVVIGSRDATRGRERAEELSAAHGVAIEGGDNDACVAGADVVVLSVPYSAHRATLDAIAGSVDGRLVVDITVPLSPPKVRQVHLPEGHAAALEAKARLGEGVTVAATLHHVSSVHLGDVEAEIDCDVLVCCDDLAARKTTMALVGDLGARAIDAGPLRNAIALESLTPVLLHMNKRYGSNAIGLRITGLPEDE